jgi:histidine ammonia-lyase/tyrosine ammonia-lyase
MTEQELNGVDDNPLVDVEALEILHGGNFMTQHIAFAADSMNSALTQAGNLAERHIEALVNPALNGGTPLLLAAQAGATSGMAGVQLTATALLAEMRSHRQQYASSSLPTNAGNQDIVPMGFQAARECYHQTERLSAILACEALCIAQLAALKGYAGAPPAWMSEFEPLREDRAMRGEIERLAEQIVRGV